MNSTQNFKINQVKDSTIIIGIDIASEIHYARAFDWRGIELDKVLRFENTLDGFTKFNLWIQTLMAKWNKSEVLLGAEPTGHYWFALANYAKEKAMKLVLVNPYHVKRSKELDDNHPTKTDQKDPKTIAKLVIEGRYSEPYIPEKVYADIRSANNNRLRIGVELGRLKNRLQRWLKIYFPEYTDVFRDILGNGSMIILRQAPLPTDVLQLGTEGINALWRVEKLRAVGIKRAQLLHQVALNSIGCREGLMTARLELEMILEDYDRKIQQYNKIMTLIQELCTQIDGVNELLEITGVGISTVAGFISEVGDIRRFSTPKQIQKLAGYAIRESSSGKHKGQSSISKRGRKRLRWILFQASLALVSKNPEFKEIHRYYTTRGHNPLKKKQSIVVICCKLIRVFYTLLTKGIKYDANKLISDIKRPLELQAV